VIFDARLGLMKGLEVKVGRHTMWMVEKFVDKIPACMVLKMAEYGAMPEQEIVYEAIEGQMPAHRFSRIRRRVGTRRYPETWTSRTWPRAGCEPLQPGPQGGPLKK